MMELFADAKPHTCVSGRIVDLNEDPEKKNLNREPVSEDNQLSGRTLCRCVGQNFADGFWSFWEL